MSVLLVWQDLMSDHIFRTINAFHIVISVLGFWNLIYKSTRESPMISISTSYSRSFIRFVALPLSAFRIIPFWPWKLTH